MSGFPLAGRLLNVEELKEQLSAALTQPAGEVLLASAYLKQSALIWARDRLREFGNVKILARWQPIDLVDGASDLEAFETAADAGWPFYVRQDFHGKVYSISQRAVFVGSANLTTSGLRLRGVGNFEVNVRAEPTEENVAFVRQLFDGAVLLNKEIYGAIRAWIGSVRQQVAERGRDPLCWPSYLYKLVVPSPSASRLLVDECFHSDGKILIAGEPSPIASEMECALHDQALLGLSVAEGLTRLSPWTARELLGRSKLHRWLVDRLKTANNRELYFGAVTEALHNSLLDEPLPYRSDVKKLVQNLFGWIQRAEGTSVIVDRPSHSQRVRLI